MSMIRFALLGLVLPLMRASSEWYLTKCCPSGEIFMNNVIECVSKPIYAIEVYGFYVQYWNVTPEFGFPQCEESEDFEATPMYNSEIMSVSLPACFETHFQLTEENILMNLIIVHCRSNEDQQVEVINTATPVPQLIHIRKCCFGDTIFDSGTRSCVTRLNDSQSLEAFLLNKSTDTESAVIASQGPPECEGPIVNYEINENDISLWNGTYLKLAVKRTLAVRICRELEFCDTNACIRKCCPEDTYTYEGDCIRLPVPNEPGEFHNALANAVNQTNTFTFDTTKGYGVLIQFPCEVMHHTWDPNDWEEYMLLTSNGHVFILNHDTNDRHCFDVMHNEFDNSSYFDFFFCDVYSEIVPDNSKDWWFAILVVKCVFLVMTLLVYAYLPNLQNIHGKTVICYVSSVLLSTTFVFIKDLHERITIEQLGKTLYKALAYIDCFLIYSKNFWLNVMCFDIWRTFGTLRENRIINNRKQRKRFLLYCLYAWGIPFLQSILIIVADNTDILPDYLKPSSFDEFACRLTYQENWNNYGDLIFLYGLLTILIISNIVFFILTTKYYNKVKADIKNVITDPRSKQLHSSRKRFIMIVKLFIVMGLPWIFHIVPYFFDKYLGYDHHWKMFYYIDWAFYYIEDLLIFIIFVLKKSVYKAICKR